MSDRQPTQGSRRSLITGAVMFLFVVLLFAVVLPRFVDYGEMLEALDAVGAGELIALLVVAGVRTFAEAGVYTAVIPGIGIVNGVKAYLASSAVANVAPPPLDLAVRYGMYRSFGISPRLSGAGVLLSGFFTIGSKMLIPVVGLVIVVANGVTDDRIVTLATISVAAFVGATALVFGILWRESIAVWIGNVIESAYNRLIAGWLKREPLEGTPDQLVALRTHILDTLRTRSLYAAAAAISSHILMWTLLVMALRFLGIPEEVITSGEAFVGYAVIQILTLVPITPAGLGVAEVGYVAIFTAIAGAEYADAIAAAAVLHRIFTWLLPTVAGVVPLIQWRIQARSERPLASETA